MNIIFVKTNESRKPEYRVSTLLVRSGGKLFVRKVADNQLASDHLEQIGQNEEMLRKELSSVTTPRCLRKSKFLREYEYLPYPSLLQLIEADLFSQRFAATKDHVRACFSVLDEIKTKTVAVYDTSFVDWFDPDKLYVPSKLEPCKMVTLLDATPANILVADKKHLSLVDNEWVFPFPAPVRFLQFRVLFYLCTDLKQVITSRTSETFPCYEVTRGLLIPKIWFDLVPFSQAEIERFLFYEASFQNRVSFVHNPFDRSTLFEAKRLVTRRFLPTLETYFAEQAAPVVNELAEIKRSKFYKVWRKYGQVKDSARRKNP